MQIDFHYDVIYVLCRYAGFSREEADRVAHSSQYVDDASHGGIVKFTNHPSYYHIRTAHGTFDIEKNRDATANFNTWVPFHFLPGGVSDGGERSSYISKMVCRAGSAIAREMMSECIRRRKSPNALHRLGIALHVFADSWAHQNFVGITVKINRCSKIKIWNSAEFMREFRSNLFNKFLGRHLPLGHNTVRLCPDISYLNWSYTDYKGKTHDICNYERFITAAEEIFKYLQRFKAGPNAKAIGLPRDKRDKILKQLKDIKGSGLERHKKWQKLIDEGYFYPGDKSFPYIPKGPNSWKGIALKSPVLNDRRLYTVDESFATSDWKKFHDAAKDHLNYVLDELLPKFEIVV